MSLFADPPEAVDPGKWPEMTLLAATILLEAEGEPEEGKVGVAYVIRTRMDSGNRSIVQVCLAPWQFSAWNEDYAGTRKARLTAPDPREWEESWRAACAAYWKLLPDPTAGADHYLNEELTRKIRGGTLPSWFDPTRVTVRINRHTFLRLA